jgi:hypothetical protein
MTRVCAWADRSEIGRVRPFAWAGSAGTSRAREARGAIRRRVARTARREAQSVDHPAFRPIA